MRLASRLREGGRDRDDRSASAGKRPKELGKTNIVANRQSEPRPRKIGNHRLGSRMVEFRFPIALAIAEIDIIHVDLVVARENDAIGRDQEGAIGDAVVAELDRHRTDMEMDGEFGGQPPKCASDGSASSGDIDASSALAVTVEDSRHLRRQHIARAVCRRRTDKVLRGRYVGGNVEPGSHLDRCGTECRHSETSSCAKPAEDIGQPASRTTLAKTSTSTDLAPPRKSALVAALTVAPVV